MVLNKVVRLRKAVVNSLVSKARFPRTPKRWMVANHHGNNKKASAAATPSAANLYQLGIHSTQANIPSRVPAWPTPISTSHGIMSHRILLAAPTNRNRVGRRKAASIPAAIMMWT